MRGVGSFGAAHMLSSVSEPGLENVATAAPDALRIYQLYVRGDEAFVEDRIERAIANGYAAFCLTVDTAHYSRRERDLAKRYVRANRRDVSGREFQMALDWRTVKRIKDKYKIPLVIKGIATAEDAEIAVDHGVEWIYVSNHGGRQLDHGRGAMHVLPEIAAAVTGRAKKSWWTARSAAAPTSSRRLLPAPIWSASAACNAGRSPQGAKPASCGCWSCWRTRCSAAWGCSASTALPNSTHPICTRPRTSSAPGVFSAFPLLEIEPYRY